MNTSRISFLLSASLILGCTSRGGGERDQRASPSDSAPGVKPPTANSDDTTTSAEVVETLPPCEPIHILAHQYAARHGDYVDCGVVDLTNSAEQWEKVHDCVVHQHEKKVSFVAVFHLRGMDSKMAASYVGIAGPKYKVDWILWDSDPCGGSGCGPVAELQTPCVLEFQNECSPGRQQAPCMRCASWTPPRMLCGPDE